ncbi:MAG TPA: hypothetical protein VJX71_17940 [Methylomirabilota bacterium]|nr:hypothetical protein [Methylomirabilota bacterium]
MINLYADPVLHPDHELHLPIPPEGWGTRTPPSPSSTRSWPALDRDGFLVKVGHLVRAMPSALGLPAVDDEVHKLLKRFGFVTPMGHLDQAVQSHGNGMWAAANGQLRSFVSFPVK